MKRFIFIFAMMFISVASFAQVKPNKVFDNVSVGVEAGVATPMDFNSVFPVNYSAGLFLQKAVTPVLGFRVNGTALFGPYNAGEFSNAFPFNGNTFVKATNVSFDGVLNWTNVFKGYAGEPRAFEVSTVTGLGWLHYFNDDRDQDSQNFMSAKTGVDFAFNFGSRKAYQVYVEPAVLWNLSFTRFPKFNSQFAQVGVNVGFVYRFTNSVGTKNFVKVREYDQAEVDRLNAKINELQSQRNRPVRPRVAPVPQVKEVVKEVNSTANVYFDFDSDVLTDAAKAELDKVTANSKVEVYGYASSEGNANYNKGLSERRAKAVADYLSNKGVTINNTAGLGVPGKEFDRVVLVKKVQ